MANSMYFQLGTRRFSCSHRHHRLSHLTLRLLYPLSVLHRLQEERKSTNHLNLIINEGEDGWNKMQMNVVLKLAKSDQTKHNAISLTGLHKLVALHFLLHFLPGVANTFDCFILCNTIAYSFTPCE